MPDCLFTAPYYYCFDATIIDAMLPPAPFCYFAPLSLSLLPLLAALRHALFRRRYVCCRFARYG